MIDLTQLLLWLVPPSVLLTWVLYQHSDIKGSLQDLDSRKHYADRLRHPRVLRLYHEALPAALNLVQRIMGEGYFFNLRGFCICVSLSIIYSFTLFIGLWVNEGPGSIGTTEFLPLDWSKWQKIFLLVLFIIVFALPLWVIWRRNKILIKFQNSFVAKLRPMQTKVIAFGISSVGALTVGVVILEAETVVLSTAAGMAVSTPCVVAVFLAGALNLRWAFAGIVLASIASLFLVTALSVTEYVEAFFLSGFVAMFLAWIGARALARVETQAIAVAGAGYGALAAVIALTALLAGFIVDDQTVKIATERGSSWFVKPIFISGVLFLLILPAINAVWDWFSLSISRRLGAAIVRRRSVGRIAKHAAIDFGAAILLLALLTATLVAAIEGVNLLGLTFADTAPLELDEFLRKTAADPWGPDGLWVTCMLLSTLVPTAAHFLMLIATLLTLVPFGRSRSRLAEQLDQPNPPAHLRSLVAWYLAWYWPMAGLILAGVFAATLWAIAVALEPVSEMLYWLALWIIDVVQFAAH